MEVVEKGSKSIRAVATEFRIDRMTLNRYMNTLINDAVAAEVSMGYMHP